MKWKDAGWLERVIPFMETLRVMHNIEVMKHESAKYGPIVGEKGVVCDIDKMFEAYRSRQKYRDERGGF